LVPPEAFARAKSKVQDFLCHSERSSRRLRSRRIRFLLPSAPQDTDPSAPLRFAQDDIRFFGRHICRPLFLLFGAVKCPAPRFSRNDTKKRDNKIFCKKMKESFAYLQIL